MNRVRDASVEVLGYEWVYGISESHFLPHRELDGVLFLDFASEALRNPRSDGWPARILAPGDHRGCHCDAQPVYADGLASAAIDAVGDATFDPSYMDVIRQMAEDDIARGFLNRYPDATSPIRTALEAERVSNVRPSRPEIATPVTDSIIRRP